MADKIDKLRQKVEQLEKKEDQLTLRFLYDKIKMLQKKMDRVEITLFQRGLMR